MRPRNLFMGLRGLIGGLPGGPKGSRGHPGDPMVGLMSLFMIHRTYMPVYKRTRFLARTDGTGPTEGSTRGPRGPKNHV